MSEATMLEADAEKRTPCRSAAPGRCRAGGEASARVCSSLVQGRLCPWMGGWQHSSSIACGGLAQLS